MDDDAPRDERMTRLEQRVSELERRLAQLRRDASPVSPVSPPPQPAPAPPPPLPKPSPAPPADAPRDPLTVARDKAETFSSLRTAAPAPPPPQTTRRAHAMPPRQRDALSLERLIGGNLFLILGALVVVGAVGFFLKLAYDQGWLSAITPLWRCVFAALFGAGLMGVGEIGAKRLGRFATTGFSGAGLAVLYATAFATYALFELVPIVVAFWMLAGVAAFGIVTGLRARSAWLSGLALVGGFLAPVIMGDPDSPAWALPAYLLALCVTGYALTLRAPRQRPLARIAWIGTLALGALWTLVRAEDAPALALVFYAAFWAIAHAGAALAVRPRRLTDARTTLLVTNSLATTSFAVGAGLLVALWTDLLPTWAITAIACAASAACALSLLHRWLPTPLASTPRRRVLAIALLGQAGVLLPLTVALGVESAWGQSLVWLALAVSACVIATRLRLTPVLWYGVALLALSTLRTLALPALGSTLYTDTLGAALGLVFSWWMIGVFASAALWFFASWVFSRIAPTLNPAVRATVAGVGATLLAIGVTHEDATPAGLLLGWALLGAGAIALARLTTLRHAAWCADAYIFLATLAWLAAYPLEGWDSIDPAPPLALHPGLLWTLALAPAWLACAHLSARALPSERVVALRAGWSVAGLLALVATSVEVARIADATTDDPTLLDGAVSVWWGVFALAALVAGVVRRAAGARYAGIALLLVAATKLLTYDLTNLSQPVRVGAFLILGLILLAVAAGYLRVGKRSRGERAE
jgi:uncharacterized membrane protein